MKHTKGPWRFIPAEEPFYRGQIAMPSHPDVPDQERIGCAPGSGPWDKGEDDGNAQLIALAPTAPHDCDDPECLGMVNKRRLEAGEGMAKQVAAFLVWTEDGTASDRGIEMFRKCFEAALSSWEKAGKGEI